MTLVTTVLLGLVYPLAITGLAQVLFPDKANGQLIERERRRDRLAHHRPAVHVAGLLPLAAVGGRHRLRRGASSASNLGPTNKKLIDRVAADVARLRQENPGVAGARSIW